MATIHETAVAESVTQKLLALSIYRDDGRESNFRINAPNGRTKRVYLKEQVTKSHFEN